MSLTAKRIFVTFVIVGLIGTGAYYLWKNYSFSDKYDFKVVGKKFKINSIRSGEFDLSLIVTNKFGIDAAITGYTISISLNGNPITTLVSNKRDFLPNNTPTPISLKGTFDPASVFKTVANFQTIVSAIKNPSSVIIGVSGNMSLNVKGVDIKNIPVDFSLKLADFLPASNS